MARNKPTMKRKERIARIIQFRQEYERNKEVYKKNPEIVKNKKEELKKIKDRLNLMLSGIRDLMREGDLFMKRVLTGTKNYTEEFVSQNITEPNNTEQITFRNGSFIKSVPPTDKIRGKSANVCIVDELAWLDTQEPDKLFINTIEPTISETQGKLIISSTPNGQVGIFHDKFDPDDKKEIQEYTRIWFDHTVNPSKHYQEYVENKRKIAEQDGKLRWWQQEYQADFVVTQTSFFDPLDVDRGQRDRLATHYTYKDTPRSIS